MSGILESIFAELKSINAKLDGKQVTGNDGSVDASHTLNQSGAAESGDAPNVTPDQPVAGVAGPELDKRGFPWDERIHAGTKGKNADGSWKIKPGIDRAVLVPQIEAELRARGYGITDEATKPGVPPTHSPAPGTPPAAVNQSAPVPPGLPGLPGAAPQPPAKVDFPQANSNDDLDDNAMVQTAAALISRHGKEVLGQLLEKFKVDVNNGGSVATLDPQYRYTFWQYASTDDFLSQLGLI